MILKTNIGCGITSFIVEKNEKLHCPNCGVKEIYTEVGNGDFYEGKEHYCKSCKCLFSMPSFEIKLDSELVSNES